MSFVNIWRKGFLPAPVADVFEYFRTIWEPGNVQRQSLKLPYAGWVPHERVSSQACLGLSAGIGDESPATKGLSRITMTCCPGSRTTGLMGQSIYPAAMVILISWPMAQMKPASSRAIAATTTIGFLPLATMERYRVQSLVCAFQAMSRTVLGRRTRIPDTVFSSSFHLPAMFAMPAPRSASRRPGWGGTL